MVIFAGKKYAMSATIEEKKHVGIIGMQAGEYSKDTNITIPVNPSTDNTRETTGIFEMLKTAPNAVRNSTAIAVDVRTE